MPGVPTLEESGIKGLNIPGWFGIVAPAKIGKETVDELIGWYRSAMADREATAKLTGP